MDVEDADVDVDVDVDGVRLEMAIEECGNEILSVATVVLPLNASLLYGLSTEP